MAKAMPYTDAYGNEHANSYWRIVQINIGVADRNVHVVFYGYKDTVSRAAGKQSIGQKSYSISGETFDELFVAHITPGGPNLMQLAYQVATTTKDVVVDPDDLTKNVSFFEDAEDLL